MIKQFREKSVGQLLKPFPGRWVALSADDSHVVTVGRSFQAVLNEAHRKGEACPHLVKSPDSSTAAFIF